MNVSDIRPFTFTDTLFLIQSQFLADTMHYAMHQKSKFMDDFIETFYSIFRDGATTAQVAGHQFFDCNIDKSQVR